MKSRPQDAKNKFYKNLKLPKEVREVVSFFQKWKKNAMKEKR